MKKSKEQMERYLNAEIRRLEKCKKIIALIPSLPVKQTLNHPDNGGENSPHESVAEN